MPSNDNNRIIIILVGILFAVMAASAALYFLLPDNASLSLSGSTISATPSSSPVPMNFNTSVFQKQEYQQLSRQFMQAGTLPVRPPVNAGKANPFL